MGGADDTATGRWWTTLGLCTASNGLERLMALEGQESLFPDAVEIIDDSGGPEGSRWRLVQDGRVVGFRLRHSNGSLAVEHGVGANGQWDGIHREWNEDGTLSFETAYVDGLEDGIARQYACDGRVIGTYRLRLGTGVDLWRDEDGSLSEERHVQDGDRHGFERWWNRDGRTVWEESHFWHGLAHGIRRQWSRTGRLRRGYPHYYLNGERVTRRLYLAASASDPTLPPYREVEDRPERQLPAEYIDPGAESA